MAGTAGTLLEAVVAAEWGMLAVVDTGPLYVVVDEDHADHERCREALERTELRLIIPALVVAEATCLVGTRLGPDVEAQFLEGLARMHVETPTPDDWPRMSQLVRRYSDFPLGGIAGSGARRCRVQASPLQSMATDP